MSKNQQPQMDLNEKFYIFDNFITSNKHILERGDKEWDSSKIFFQLSIEHADNSPLTHGAEDYENDGKVDWDYLLDDNRQKKFIISPRTHLFETGNSPKKIISKHINIDDKYLIVTIEDYISEISELKLFYIDSFEYITIDMYNSNAHTQKIEDTLYILFRYRNGVIRLFDKLKLKFINSIKASKEGKDFKDEFFFTTSKLVQYELIEDQLTINIYELNSLILVASFCYANINNLKVGNLIYFECDYKIISIDCEHNKEIIIDKFPLPKTSPNLTNELKEFVDQGFDYQYISNYVLVYDNRTKAIDKTIKVLDKKTFKKIGVIQGHIREGFMCTELTNNRLLTIASDSTMKIWDLKDFSLINSINTTFGALRKPYYDKTRDLIICSYPEEFSIYTLDFRAYHISKEDSYKVNGMSTYINDENIAIAKGKNIEVLNKKSTNIRTINFSGLVKPLETPNFKICQDSFFITQLLNRQIVVKDFKNYNSLYTFQGSGMTQRFEIISNKYIVISNKKELILIDVYLGKEIDKLDFEFNISNMKLIKHELIVSSKSGDLAFIKVENGNLNLILKQKTDTQGLKFNDYSKNILLEKEDKSIVLYDDKVVYFKHTTDTYVSDVLDYKEILVTIQRNFVNLWDKTDGTLIKSFSFEEEISINSQYDNILVLNLMNQKFVFIDILLSQETHKIPIEDTELLFYEKELLGKEKQSDICKSNQDYFACKVDDYIYILDKKSKKRIFWYPSTLSYYNFKILDVDTKYFIFSDHNHIKYLQVVKHEQ